MSRHDISISDADLLTVARTRDPIAPERLACAHPGGRPARSAARTLYRRCLDYYREHVPPAGPALDDAAVAAAHFVAACLHALNGTAVTPERHALLKRELGVMLLRHRPWLDASAAERRFQAESMALLSVLIRESSHHAHQQGAAAIAHVRSTARAYLRQLLGVDAELLARVSGAASAPAVPASA